MKLRLDKYDQGILLALQENAKLSHAEIGRRVHLGQSSVSERIKRLEEARIIRGYRADVDYSKVGYPVCAIVRVDQLQGRPYEKFVKDTPEIIECFTVTGDDCAILRVITPDVERLGKLIEQLNGFGPTSTAVVISIQVQNKNVLPLLES